MSKITYNSAVEEAEIIRRMEQLSPNDKEYVEVMGDKQFLKWQPTTENDNVFEN